MTIEHEISQLNACSKLHEIKLLEACLTLKDEFNFVELKNGFRINSIFIRNSNVSLPFCDLCWPGVITMESVLLSLPFDAKLRVWISSINEFTLGRLEVNVASLVMRILPLPDLGLGSILLEHEDRHENVVLRKKQLVADDASVTRINWSSSQKEVLALSKGS